MTVAIFSVKSASRCQLSSACPPSQNEEQTDRHLSAWEKWILEKARKERDAAEENLQKQEEMERKAELERSECEKKKSEAAAKIRAWIEQYDVTLKQKRWQQKKREKAEQELKEEKKLEILNKSRDKFQVGNVALSVTATIVDIFGCI